MVHSTAILQCLWDATTPRSNIYRSNGVSRMADRHVNNGGSEHRLAMLTRSRSMYTLQLCREYNPISVQASMRQCASPICLLQCAQCAHCRNCDYFQVPLPVALCLLLRLHLLRRQAFKLMPTPSRIASQLSSINPQIQTAISAKVRLQDRELGDGYAARKVLGGICFSFQPKPARA